MNIVRDNLLTSLGYTPYCGGATCGWHWPRTTFKGLQFHCKCGWVSAFEPEFIEQYKAAQAKLKAGLDAQPVTCPPNGMTVTHAPHFIEQTAEHTDGVQACELPDAIRVPLDELEADAAYIIGRVAADGSCSGIMVEAIRHRTRAIREALLARGMGGSDAPNR